MAKKFNEELKELNAYSIMSEELDELESYQNIYPESELTWDIIESMNGDHNEIKAYFFNENLKHLRQSK